jgi:hypothetical protein
MKYLVLVILLGSAFVGGMYYENSRLLGEPDTTVAVLFANTAIENSKFFIGKHEQYQRLLSSGQLEELEKEMQSSKELLESMKKDMLATCDQPDVHCKERHRKLLSNREESNETIPLNRVAEGL